jgi:hypothetical protein
LSSNGVFGCLRPSVEPRYHLVPTSFYEPNGVFGCLRNHRKSAVSSRFWRDLEELTDFSKSRSKSRHQCDHPGTGPLSSNGVFGCLRESKEQKYWIWHSHGQCQQLRHSTAYEGNRIRREGDATPEGKTLKGESHERKGYEIRP